jgi:hypothetical protein
MGSFRRLILLGNFFGSGSTVAEIFSRRSVIRLKVRYGPFENLMVRVPHHDPEHGGSIFLTTLSLPFESVRALSLSKWSMGRRVRVRQAHPTSKYPEEDRGAVSASNRFMAQTALEHYLMRAGDDFLDQLMSDRG